MSFSSEKGFCCVQISTDADCPTLMKCLEQSNDDHQHVRHAHTASELHKAIFFLPKEGIFYVGSHIKLSLLMWGKL